MLELYSFGNIAAGKLCGWCIGNGTKVLSKSNLLQIIYGEFIADKWCDSFCGYIDYLRQYAGHFKWIANISRWRNANECL